MTDRIVIIGAGECGIRAASALREQSYNGSITLVGAETLHPYERPPLSKTALTDPADPAPTTIAGPQRMEELDINFLAGTSAMSIDRHEHLVRLGNGETAPYDRVLLTTGARARTLSLPGGDSALTLRTFDDSVDLRQHLRHGARVVIVGAGFIGLEVAASAVGRGCQVTVIEVVPRVMGRAVPADIAGIFAARHRAAGVDLRCGVGIERIEVDGQNHRVVLAGDDVVECDVVIAGVGAVPNTDVAERSGLAIENGIRVDEYLRTDDPSIFAAGDCCSFPHQLFGGRRLRLEAWRNAIDQGTVAAANILGAEQPYLAVPWFWSDQYDLSLQIAGVGEAATSTVVRSRPDGSVIHFGLDDGGRLVSASGAGSGNTVAKEIRIAEMLIARRAHPDRAALAEPATNLKTLLNA
jgi:3-phenylpropionate/trans-cinnamate dioxygenase ferredoxin reductase component